MSRRIWSQLISGCNTCLVADHERRAGAANFKDWIEGLITPFFFTDKLSFFALDFTALSTKFQFLRSMGEKFWVFQSENVSLKICVQRTAPHLHASHYFITQMTF